MTCRACGSENRVGIAFCERCGTQVQPSAEACEHPNRRGTRFCETCGRSIEGAQPVETRVEADDSQTSSTAPSSIGRCGHPNRPTVSYCEWCGADLRPGSLPPVATPRPVAPSDSKVLSRTRRISLVIGTLLLAAAGGVGAFLVIRADTDPTPADLLDALPDAASLGSCNDLATAASDFAHAAAAVAADDPSLVEDLSTVGAGFEARTTELACDDALLAGQVSPSARPGEGATTAEVVEFVLRGGDVAYPDNTPAWLSTGGTP